MTFGDDDPEDGWDAADPVPEKVDRLIRWAASVLIERAYDGTTPRVTHRATAARGETVILQHHRELTPTQVAALALILIALEDVT